MFVFFFSWTLPNIEEKRDYYLLCAAWSRSCCHHWWCVGLNDTQSMMCLDRIIKRLVLLCVKVGRHYRTFIIWTDLKTLGIIYLHKINVRENWASYTGRQSFQTQSLAETHTSLLGDKWQMKTIRVFKSVQNAHHTLPLPDALWNLWTLTAQNRQADLSNLG